MSGLLTAGLVVVPFSTPVSAAEPAPPATEGWTRSTYWQRQPDGRVKVRAYPATAFARRGKAWIPLDARLRDTGDGQAPYAAPDALVPLRVGAVSNRVVELTLPEGPVRLTAPGLDVGNPERNANVVTFRDVAEDTDLLVEVTAHGLRTQFVLKSERAPRSFELRLSDPHGQLGDVRKTEGDGYEFTKKVDGDLVLKLSPGFAYEQSDTAGGAPAGVQPGSAHLSVRKDGSDFVLAKSVDAGWLQGKQFPIVLDPIAWLEGTELTTDCHMVSGTRIDTNYCPSTSFEIGYHASDTLIRRVLLNFDLPAMPEGSTVDSGTPNLWLVNNITPTATTTAPTYDVYETSTSWTTDVTWRRRNATTNWTTAGGTWFAGARGSAVMERGAGNATVIPINTAMIQKWATNPPTDNGMIVRARSESTQTMLRFGSSEHAEQAQWPLLEYTYTEAPSAPSSITVVPGRAKAIVSWGAATQGDEPIAKYLVRANCASSGCPAETQVFECSASCRTLEVTVGGGYYYTFEVRAQDVGGRTGAAVTSGATFVRSNLAPLVPDNLSPPIGSKLRTYPNECGRYRDPEADPGTIVVDIRRPDGTPVTTGVRSLTVVNGATACVGPNLPEGDYRWDAVAMDDALLTSPRTAVQSFLIDNSPPAPPALSSTTHADQSAWYRTNSVTMNISASDLSGIDGHSWHYDGSPGVLPDETIDLTGSTLSRTWADGDHYVHVRSCNGVALCSAVSDYRLRIDTVVPNTPAISSMTHTPGAWSNVKQARVDWSVPFDATSGIAGYRTAWNQTATFTPTTLNTFSATSTSPVLTDGDWYFHLSAVDRAGNVSGVVTRGPFKIDAALPGAPTLSSTTHPSQTTWSSNNAATMTWSATDTSGITAYSYELNQSATKAPDLVADTSLASTTVAVPDGTNYFHVRALDGAGNWSGTTTYTLLVDATAPLVSSITSTTHADPAKWYSNASPALSWAAADVSGITGYSYVLDQSPATLPDGTSEGTATSRTFGPLAEGVHYLHVRAINGSGLVGAVLHRTIRIDTTAPATPAITSSHSSTAWSANNDVTFAWTQQADLSGIAGYAVVLDQNATTTPPVSTPLTTATAKAYDDLADGVYYLHVRPINGADLWGAVAHYKVQIDATAASVTSLVSSTHPDNTKWYQADDVTVSYAATDLSGITGYSVSVDSFPTGEPDTTVDTTATTHSFADLPDGVWYVHVRAINGTNLPGPVATFKVLIDDTVPTAPTVTSSDHPVGMTTNQRVVNLDWTNAAGSDATSGLLGYHVAFTSSPTPVTTGTADVTATKYTSASLGDGTWYAHVRAVDRAGNGAGYVYGPIHVDPNAPPVSDAERDKFVALWKPRVTSDTFGKPYLETPGYPVEILLEGFHGYNPVQKAYLVDKLWAVLVAENPVPAGQEATVSAARDEVHDFVFAKERFLLPPLESGIVDEVVSALPVEVPILQPLLDLLDLRRGRAVVIPTLDVPVLPDLGDEEVLPEVGDTLEPLTEDATAALSAETNAALDSLQNTLSDTLTDITNEVAAVAAETVPINPDAVFDVIDLLPVDAGYRVCYTYRGREGCQRVALLGVPALVDVSGDGTPDVAATLSPTVNVTNALGVGFGWDVRRSPVTNDMEGKKLDAHVWAEYDVPLYDTRVSIGFDGSRGRLSNAGSTMELTMTDPTRLQQRDVLAKYAITHEETSTWEEWAVTIGVRRITADPDPTTARIAYTPPANADGDLQLVNDDTETVRNRTITFTSELTTNDPVALRIDGAEVVAARSERTDVAVRIPVLRRQTSLSLRDYAAGGDERDMKLDFSASARTQEVSANANIQRGSQRLRLLATLKDLPTTASYHLTNKDGDGHHNYTANGTLGSLAAAVELVDGATRLGTATLRATSVPASMDLRHTPDPADRELILVDYTAGGVVPSLDATGYYQPEALSVKLSAKDVPALLTGEADTRLKHVSFDAVTPLTLLDATVTRKTTKVSRLAGDHVTIITPTTGTFGLSARVAGLKAATFDMGDVMKADATLVPGGQKLSVGGQINTVFFSGEVSNVPSKLYLELDRVKLKLYYAGSAIVPKIRGYAGLKPGGPHFEATLTQVPTEVTVQAAPNASSGVITYNANGVLGSIERIVATSDGTVGDNKGTTLQGRLSRLPRTATLTVDRTLRTFSFSGDQAVGEIDLTMSRNGARPQRAAMNHLTLTGTSTAWAVGIRLPNVKSASLDLSQGLTRSSGSLVLSTADTKGFVANGNLDGVRFYASLSNLPAQFSFAANGTQELTYTTGSVIRTLVVYVAKTGTGPTLRGAFESTPVTGTVRATLAKPKYTLRFDGSSPMTSVSGFYSSRYVDAAATATTDFISGSAKGLPTWVSVQLDTAAKQVSFSSDRGLDEVQARAKGLLVDGLNAEALLRNLPANAHVHYDVNDVLFDGLGGTIGYAFARGSNYGAPPKRLPGRHVYLRADLPRKLFKASAELTNVSTAKVLRTGSDLELAGSVDIGASKLELDLQAEFYPPGTTSGTPVRMLIDGNVVGFPSQLKVGRVGDVVTYHADRNLDANIEIGAGYPLALNRAPAPPARNGFSVTDGQCAPNEGCPTTKPDGTERLFCQADRNRCLGFRGRLDYDGLPTDVVIRMEAHNDVLVTTSALQATSPRFEARAEIAHFTPWPITIDAGIGGVLPGTTLAVGPVRLGKLDATGGAHVFAKVAANRDLGAMDLRVKAGAVLDFQNYRYRDFDVSAELVRVPKSFEATVEFGYKTRLKLLSSTAMPGRALELHAYATVQQKTGTNTFTTIDPIAEATLYLDDIPASPTVPMDLQITMPSPHGDAGPMVLPGLTYSAPESTLDGAIAVDPAWGHLLLSDGLIDANLTDARIEFANLSSNLTVAVDPVDFSVAVEAGALSPRTEKLSAQIRNLDATVHFDQLTNSKRLGVRLLGTFLGDVRAQIGLTRVELLDVRELYLTPGRFKLAWGVEGQYTKFGIHASDVDVDVTLDLGVRVRPWPDWSWAGDVYADQYKNTIHVNKFESHVNLADEFGPVGKCFKGRVALVPVSAKFHIKPAPQPSAERLTNSMVIMGTDGKRKVATMFDPGWADLISDLVDVGIAAVEDPFDTGDWRLDTAMGNGAC